MFKDKIFPHNTSANDVLESCFVYVNNTSGEHNLNDVPASIGMLIVFSATPWWGMGEICVAQLYIAVYYNTSKAYFRFKNNNKSFSYIPWVEVQAVG